MESIDMLLFVLLALFAVFPYIRGYKVTAMVIFFFFLTGGFNLIPDELVDLGVPLTKNADYAFFILLFFLIIESFCTKKFLHIDTYVKYLIVFFSFLFLCIIFNRFSIGVGWGEILRTVRYLFFLLAYFVFRSLDRAQLIGLLKVLFSVTIFISVLYLLQLVVGTNILDATQQSEAVFLGTVFPRFYNQPDMIQFFAIMAIYCNPFRGKMKIISTTILILALLGAFHRSLIGFFVLSLLIGWILSLSKLRQIQIFTVGSFLAVFIIIFAGHRFTQSRTYIDLQKVMSGNFAEMEIDVTDLSESTFTFRIAHLFERNQYLLENPKAMLLGAGLFTEDSKKIDKMFDFKVGLIEELSSKVVQVDTGDISYSGLLLRFGYLGTILNLFLFFYLMFYFFKNREDKYAKFSFLYLVLTFGISFFSANLIIPVTFLMPMISYLIVEKGKTDTKELT